MKKATIAATAGIAVTAFAAPTIASASTVVVEAGDTLWGIAQSKGTTVDAIKKANNLTTDKIVPGQKLQVNEVAAAEKTEKSVSATWLNVRSGAGVDNSIITSIKGGTKVTVESTESNGWNKITYNDGETGFVNGKYLTDKVASTPVAPTQEVKKETTTQQAAPAAETKTEVKQTTQATTPAPKVAETKETPVVDQNATTHAVKSGDTIWALSVKYGVSVQDIMSWNNLSSSSIYVGQKLAIKQTANTATPKAEVKKEAPAAEKQAAPVVKENTNTNTNATTEKKKQHNNKQHLKHQQKLQNQLPHHLQTQMLIKRIRIQTILIQVHHLKIPILIQTPIRIQTQIRMLIKVLLTITAIQVRVLLLLKLKNTLEKLIHGVVTDQLHLIALVTLNMYLLKRESPFHVLLAHNTLALQESLNLKQNLVI